MRMNFYARMRNDQNTKHQEKGRLRLNILNTRDEYYNNIIIYCLKNVTNLQEVKTLVKTGNKKNITV